LEKLEMKLAYADPPYIGQAKKHYSDQALHAEVDHGRLVFDLVNNYDGWALSCSSTTLQQILVYCPKRVRIGAWVKPFASFKPGVNPAYAWEPVIFMPARENRRDKDTVRDWFSGNITMQKGVHGAKPFKFCYWLFDILGAEPGDTLDDLYPGTGIVSTAWASWVDQKSTALISPGLLP
jgi:hypothetical protein